MATSLEISEKEVLIDHLHQKRFHSIVKIGPEDPKIICLGEIIKKVEEKKKEINASKIYSPVGNLAEWAKKVVQSASKIFMGRLQVHSVRGGAARHCGDQ